MDTPQTPPETPVRITSKKYRVDLIDVAKGFAIACMTPITAGIYLVLENQSLDIPWRSLGITGLAAGVLYLSKRFVTPAKEVKDVEPPK